MSFIILPAIVNAAMLGVNKININYDNVLRNGYAEDSIIVSLGTEQEIQVFYEARGEIKDWIRFEPQQPIIVSDNSHGFIKIIVEPPADTRSDTYEGTVIVTTGYLGNVTGNIGSNIVVAFEEKIKVTVTDTQTIDCVAGGFEIQDSEIANSLPLIATVSNGGNVRIKPDIIIKVYDQERNELVKELRYVQEEEILPTTTKRIETELQNDLEPGQYWAEVKSDMCEGSSTLTFSVLEKGGISDKGDFIRLANNPWADTGELVPITASFKNRGERTVTAQFKGIVSVDSKILEVIKSDAVDVDPGETVELEMFYSPKTQGQYKINGRINYNNKITIEKGSVLNVEGESIIEINYELILAIILIVVVLIIGFFGLLILKNKAKRRRRPF